MTEVREQLGIDCVCPVSPAPCRRPNDPGAPHADRNFGFVCRRPCRAAVLGRQGAVLLLRSVPAGLAILHRRRGGRHCRGNRQRAVLLPLLLSVLRTFLPLLLRHELLLSGETAQEEAAASRLIAGLGRRPGPDFAAPGWS